MAISNSEIVITAAPLESPGNDWTNAAGASVDFWGVVRAVENGEEISGIEYEVNQTMAQHQMETIVRRARREFKLETILLRHRIGFIAAGEASLFLRVSSAHRAAAFRGSQWIIAELKQRVPIWKRPVFVRPKQTGGTQPAQSVAAGE